MQHTTTETFTYNLQDVVKLIKEDVRKHHPLANDVKVVFSIDSRPGYDGPGIPPQELTKVTASFLI